MKKIICLIILAGFLSSFCAAQSSPPELDTLLGISIRNGYLPDTIYSLVVKFNENSNARSFRLKISNQASPGLIGIITPVAPNLDTITENGMFYLQTVTPSSSVSWNFRWRTPPSASETIRFELVATAEDVPGIQSDITYTCIYQATNSSFGLTGNCSNTWQQVGIDDQFISINSLEIFPNPAEQIATISYALKETANVQVDILDLSGKLIQHILKGVEVAGDREHSLNVSDLPTGTYLARILVSNKPHYHKFTVR